MNQQHKIWQVAWHRVLKEPLVENTPIDVDFALHFDIWELDKASFFQLFESFPSGRLLAERAYQLRWGDISSFNQKLSQQELIEETKKCISILQEIAPTEDLRNPVIDFKSGDDDLRMELLSQADPLSISLDDELSELIRMNSGAKAEEAYFFLIEPFYRMSSYYIPAYWILWSLTGLEDQNPYTSLLKLMYNNCDAVLRNEGVLIYQRIA